MAKTLKHFLEGYLKVKSADEQKFIDKHVTAKNPDRNGNGDDVFKGSTKTIDRRKDRKGYNPGEDEKVYEELKGKQHKIDANKNGKLDTHDFKLLRAKKKVAEAIEELDELSKDTVQKYKKAAVKDYYDADDVDDGRRVGQRYKGIKMANRKLAKEEVDLHENAWNQLGQRKPVGNTLPTPKRGSVEKHGRRFSEGDYVVPHTGPHAGEVHKVTSSRVGSVNIVNPYGHKYDSITVRAKHEHLSPATKQQTDDHKARFAATAERMKASLKEEAEQIDEISADMADRYLKGKRERDWKRSDDGSYSVPRRPQSTRRKNIDARGTSLALRTIQRPRNMMAKEEAEQIDELSKKTLGSYVNKANFDSGSQGMSAGEMFAGGKAPRAQMNRMRKRATGVEKAVDRLTKEEAELDEKLNMDKASMGTVVKDFQKSNAPQFKGKSQDKRRAMAIAAKLTAERGGKPLNKEERLQNLLNNISESHQRVMLEVFDKLNEDNKSKFLEACLTLDGVDQMLDFAISHRGE
jgi:hypothetical protein